MNWISVWLVAALFAVGGFIVYASYTGLVVAKRVVSVSESAGVLFSSNRMETFVGDQITTRHLTSSSTGDFAYPLTVCDFAQNDPYTRYGSPISYTLTAQLVVSLDGSSYLPVTQAALGNNYDGVRQDLGLSTENDSSDDKTYTIQYISQGGESVTSGVIDLRDGAEHTIENLELLPTGNGTDKFRVVFDKSEFTDSQTYDYYILVKALPDGSLTALNDIACYLYASKVNVLSSAWTGKLQEQDNGVLGDYDAYNYVIEGSGSATVRLKWDPTVVEISEISLHDMGITPQTYTEGEYNGWKYFEMEVDSSQKGRYEMQVFKTAGEANDAIISQKIIFG